jgi:integrase/recombinase XerD
VRTQYAGEYLHVKRRYLPACKWQLSRALEDIVKSMLSSVLRHSTAMERLLHGVDQIVIALWLGHENVETTQVYVHADLRLKEKALARVTALKANPGRYPPDDKLLAFLESL